MCGTKITHKILDEHICMGVAKNTTLRGVGGGGVVAVFFFSGDNSACVIAMGVMRVKVQV